MPTFTPRCLARLLCLLTLLALLCANSGIAAGLDNTVIYYSSGSMTGGESKSYAFLSSDGNAYRLCGSGISKYTDWSHSTGTSLLGPWSFSPSDSSGKVGLLIIPSLTDSGGKAVTLDAPVDTARYGSVDAGPFVRESFTISRPAPVRACTNFSSRMRIEAKGTGTLGLVVEKETRLYLIRGVCKSLTKYGVSPVVSATSLKVFNSKSAQFLTGRSGNESAGSQAALAQLGAMVGATPLDSDSSEQVVLWAFAPGLYTIECSNPQTSPGECLVEAFALPFAF